MIEAITVSQINRYLKLKMDHDTRLNDIYISGEISNFTSHLKSGHFYFSLKDDDAVIKAVMFRQHASTVKFLPFDGQKVIVRGQVSVFERDGIYQIYVTEMIAQGAGNLALAFEQLKDKLREEGLFSEEHKKALPKYPEKIGVITSPTGAALQDMLNILERRYPLCEVFLYPALVQGEMAAQSLIDGLKWFSKNKSVDVILIGRGGGSAEELWCFNDESLAREIYACEIPVISCVGHETDFTISDFVADLRAPTPSAAAELCTPDYKSEIYHISELQSRAEYLVNNKIEALSDRLTILNNRQCLKNSDYYFESMKQRLESLSSRPCLKNPLILFELKQNKLRGIEEKVFSLSEKVYTNKALQLAHVSAKVDALSPLKVLSRGFSVVTKDKKIVTANKLKPQDDVSVVFHDGVVNAKIVSVEERG